MFLDYSTLNQLLQSHPAWRLLRSDHVPLIASFLQRVFIIPNERVMSQAQLVEALEDELFALRERLGDNSFPKSALDYLNDWAATERGWLRKFYQQHSDEPYFDLTPSTEKAIAWLTTLTERSFVGTESRLMTLFELLKQMSTGSEADPQVRIAQLQQQRDAIDDEIARVLAGNMRLLDDTALKDRFQQFTQMARELLADFREVEHNFRRLDRRVRERIALWNGSKGALLQEIMGERDVITDSDQGKNFRAFWDFLMSSSRQDELTTLIKHVLTLPPVMELKPDARTHLVHHDWLEAGEHTQRTVAQLSQQLRRFLDDQTWLENRRIMEILHEIEAKTLILRKSPPMGAWMSIADTGAEIELPMERPLYRPTIKPSLANIVLEAGEVEIDIAALYSQIVVDTAQLARHIRHALQSRSQVTLSELCTLQPLQHGLAELVAYLQLATDAGHNRSSHHGFKSVVDDVVSETISWRYVHQDGREYGKQVQLSRVIYLKT